MILPLPTKTPTLGPRVFVAPTATVAGEVTLAEDVSIWFGAVLRGDVGAIRIGARTNIQDGAILHMSTGVSDAVLGADVTVGHGAIIHGATVADHVLIGMGAILLDGAKVGAYAMVGAGALLPPGFEVPAGMLALGAPAKIVRATTATERRQIDHAVASYLALKEQYAASVGV